MIHEPHILIVDDDDLLRSYLIEGLNHKGWSFSEAVDGSAAVLYLYEVTADPAKPVPDVIILDVNMPEMDGFTTLDRIKERSVLRDIPVIMLTSSDEDISVIRGYTAGAVEYLLKPVELSALTKGHLDL
jgi:DNA-binding response OmpR family regulator